MYKAHQVRTTFGSWDVEKVHAVVARSTFPSQNVQNTTCSRHFWRFGCWKSARRCGAKHISKWKCTKHTMFGPLLEVEMSKKCTPLWREAHFQVKMYKTHHARTTFGSWDVEKVHAVVAQSTFPSQNVQNTPCSDHFLEVEMSKKCTPLWRKAHVQVKMYKTHQVRTTFGSWDVEKVHAVVARSTFPSQNVQNTTCSRHFWRFGCWKSARRCGAKHISKWKCTKHTMFGPLLEVQMSLCFASLQYTTLHTLHFTTLHYITLNFTTLHSTTLQLQLHNYTPLHSTTLHYTKLHYTTLRYTTLHNNTTTTTQLHSTTLNDTTLHYITLHSTTLHYITLHYTTFRYTSLHYTTLHSTTTTTTTTQLHSTTLHYTPLHSTILHYTKLHYTTLHYTTLHYNYTTTLHYTPLHYSYTCDYTTTLHYTKLHYTTLHSTTLHYTILHYTTLHYTEWHCTTDRQVDR